MKRRIVISGGAYLEVWRPDQVGLRGEIGMSEYTIHEHSHRFAVWAAGRAYSRGGEGGGYTVSNARLMLEAAGLRGIKTVDDLPEASQIDSFLNGLITGVINARPRTYTQTIPKKGDVPATKVERTFICSYGRAQKLVNIYLKSKIICAGAPSGDSRIAKLHPPLDMQLLVALDKLDSKKLGAERYERFRKAWNTARSMGTSWTDFDKATYDAHIKAIKELQDKSPLWAVEEHWMSEKKSE